MRVLDIDDIVDAIDQSEYDELFPIEQEYALWIDSVERDFQEEADRRVALAERELSL